MTGSLLRVTTLHTFDFLRCVCSRLLICCVALQLVLACVYTVYIVLCTTMPNEKESKAWIAEVLGAAGKKFVGGVSSQDLMKSRTMTKDVMR